MCSLNFLPPKTKHILNPKWNCSSPRLQNPDSPASVWRSADLCKQTQDGSDQQEGDVGLQEILKPMTVPTDGVVI